MNLEELRDSFRDLADDKNKPFKWSNEEIARYLSEAESEAAIRALLLYDDETAAYCSVAVVAGTARYPINQRVIRIERARLLTAAVNLQITDEKYLDANCSDWETSTGVPAYLIPRARKVRLVAAPTVADTLALSVYRQPLKDLADNAQIPEIPLAHHFKLLDWALHLAYLKHDADAFDEDHAAAHAAKFTASFGPHPGVDTLVKRNIRRHPPVVRYGGL